MKNPLDFQVKKEHEEFIWLKFLEQLRETKSEKYFKEILENVLSVKEKKLIVNRLIAVTLIKRGKTYREIGEILWLSPNTISAIKKSLFKKSFYQGYRRGLDVKTANQKFKKKNAIQDFQDLSDASIEFLEAINRGLNKILPPITGKGRWNYLNDRSYYKNKK